MLQAYFVRFGTCTNTFINVIAYRGVHIPLCKGMAPVTSPAFVGTLASITEVLKYSQRASEQARERERESAVGTIP